MSAKRAKLTTLTCPYCRAKFEIISGVVHCKKCSTAYHDICWYQQTVCGTYGCGGTETQEEKKEGRHELLVTAGYTLAGSILFFAVAYLIAMEYYVFPLMALVFIIRYLMKRSR